MRRTRENVETPLLVLGWVVGILLTGWGTWVLYVGIANTDPGSELPRWFAVALALALLAVGVWLLVLVRSALRRKHLRT